VAVPWDVKWQKPSRQVQGRITERKLLQDIGARVHPNSGAGHIKEDGSDEEHLYEVKDCRKSFTLKASDLRQSFVRAVRQQKTSVWMIHFSDAGFTAEVRLIPGGKELLHD
jgi:hypothetical protein